MTLNSNLSVVKNAYFGGPIMKIPAGVEINRPASNAAPAGSIYFNTDTYRFEGLHDLGPNGKEWKPFGGVMDIDADTYITAEKTPDNDTISFYADNADVPRMTMTSGLLSVALPTNIANTLSVQGATTLSSTLSVTAATTLSSTLSVADAVFMSNTLSVFNVASFDNTVKIFGKLSVTDKAILADTLSVGKEVYMSSNLSVIGAMELGGTLSVTGATHLKSTLSVIGNTEMGGSLSVTGDAYLTAGLSVAGNTLVLGKLSVSDATFLKSTLSVGGASTLTSTLSVGNDVELTTNLSVQGNTEMAGSLSVGNDVVFSTNLSVLGNAELVGTLSVTNKTFLKSDLSVSGNTEMVGTLSVANQAFLKSHLSVIGNTEMVGTLSVAGSTFINNVLSVNEDVYINSTNGSLFTSTIKDMSATPGEGTLTIDVGTLLLKGNLDVAGTYNTVDISTSSIHVEDKLLVLSTASDYTGGDINVGVTDGADVNDQAGLQIAGIPDAYPTGYASTDDIYEKSLKWNINGGFANMGYLQENMDNDGIRRDDEPFWELKGGAFHLSADQYNEAGTEIITVKYGFRINPNGELEIMKKIGADPSKRVAKFGITSAF